MTDPVCARIQDSDPPRMMVPHAGMPGLRIQTPPYDGMVLQLAGAEGMRRQPGPLRASEPSRPRIAAAIGLNKLPSSPCRPRIAAKDGLNELPWRPCRPRIAAAEGLHNHRGGG